MGRRFVTVLVAAALAMTAGCTLEEKQGAAQPPVDQRDAAVEATTVTIRRSPSCGCCGEHIDYLRDAGFVVEDVLDDEVTAFKDAQGVPDDHRSCHTGEVGGYTIEGHVPAGAIEALLAERPDIDGIAVPGMPDTSPGMTYTPAPVEVVTFADGAPVGVLGTF